MFLSVLFFTRTNKIKREVKIMKLSCIFGKKVVSEKGKTGYVISVLADKNKIVCLVCADEKTEAEFTVDADCVKSMGEIIIFKEEKAQKSGTPLRLGKPVFDCGGNYLGKLKDITVEKFLLSRAHIGNKKFAATDLVCGDAIIVKSSARILKSDVKSGGKVLIKRGTPLTPEIMNKARVNGEYVQTSLKTI